jgi:predicted membrane channel-forming protein YqfA (hemolysin III family)
MKIFTKTEFVILLILWLGSLITYSIALINNYDLYVSDYLGLGGLIIATTISVFKPEKALVSVIILLLLGLFNLLSFVYFVNVVISFGIVILVTPGIQLISLVLLIVLSIKEKEKVRELYQQTLGETEDEKENAKLNAKNRFKLNFEKLTDKEIDYRLEQGLVPEAIEALKEIKEERKTHYNNA